MTPPLEYVELGDRGERRGEAVRSWTAEGKEEMCRLSLLPAMSPVVLGGWACSDCTTSAKEMKDSRRTSLGSRAP